MVNEEQIIGQWNQIKGHVKEQWGKLTDDDITKIAGKKDQLIGKLQEKYGYQKERAEKEFSEWQRKHSREKVEKERTKEKQVR